MTLANLQRDARAYAWVLDIAGVGVRYYSGQAPPLKDYGAGWYDMVEAILPERLGSQSQRLNEFGGISEHGAIRVVLASRGERAEDNDPRNQLCRLGFRGAIRKARVIETIEHTGAMPARILLDRDLTGWDAYPNICHIGQEAFYYQVVDTPPGGPYELRGITRAYLDTRRQEHRYDPTLGWSPWCYFSQPVTWRGRRCSLKVAPRLGRALTDADYIEVCRGMIDAEPELADDGLSVSLTIAPITIVLGQKLGAGVPDTSLCQGYHYFDGVNGTTLYHEQAWIAGAAYSQPTSAAGGIGDTWLNVPTEPHADVFDPSLPEDHPRHGHLLAGRAGQTRFLVDGYTPPDEIDVTPALLSAIPTAELTNDYAVESCPAVVASAPGVLRWPDAAVAAAVASWAPGTNQGADGRWADVLIDTAGPRPRLIITLNNSVATPGPLRVTFRGDNSRGEGHARISRHDALWFGIDFAAPDEDSHFDAREGPDTPREQERRETDWEHEISVGRTRGVSGPPLVEDIRRYASAYYQTGEERILVTRDVLGSGAAQYIAIEADGQTQVCAIVAKSAEVDPDTGSDIGYSYKIRDSHRRKLASFGDFGGTPVRIRPCIQLEDDPPGIAILRILLSGRGNFVNHNLWDSEPFGANLDEDDVDEMSFRDFPTPPIMARLKGFRVPEGKTIGDAIKPLLEAMSASLGMRYDPETRTQRLALVPVGLPVASDFVASLTSGEIATEGRPHRTLDRSVVLQWICQLNYDATSDKPGLVVTVADGPGIQEANGDAPDRKLELRGVYLDNPSAGDAAAQLLPMLAGKMRHLGNPRLKLRFRVGGNHAFRAQLGDVIRLTAVDGVGFDAAWGVTGATARIVGKTVEWSGEGCELEVELHPAKTAGWAPALRVASVVNGTNVTVDANRFTRAAHPVTGAVQTDLSYWAVNDPVACVRRGRWQARVLTTITVIAGNQITTGAAHLLSVGDTLRVSSFDNATAIQQAYVYLADSGELIGAANVAAYQFGN